VQRDICGHITPITLLRKLSRQSRQYFLLESIEGGEKWGRYSFLGFDPIKRATLKNHMLTINSHKTTAIETKNPMKMIKKC
jgi:anthranilate synthase component 1